MFLRAHASYLPYTFANLTRVPLISFAINRLFQGPETQHWQNDVKPNYSNHICVAEILKDSKRWLGKRICIKGELHFLKDDAWLTVVRGKSALHADLTYEFTDTSHAHLTVLDCRSLASCESLISMREPALKYRLKNGNYQLLGTLKRFESSQETFLLLEQAVWFSVAQSASV
jgi:hypothetical protein